MALERYWMAVDSQAGALGRTAIAASACKEILVDWAELPLQQPRPCCTYRTADGVPRDEAFQEGRCRPRRPVVGRQMILRLTSRFGIWAGMR